MDISFYFTHNHIAILFLKDKESTIKSYLCEPMVVHASRKCHLLICSGGVARFMRTFGWGIVHYFILFYFYGFIVLCSHQVQCFCSSLGYSIIFIVHIYLVSDGSFSPLFHSWRIFFFPSVSYLAVLPFNC